MISGINYGIGCVLHLGLVCITLWVHHWKGEISVSKPCRNCGAALPDNASFCPECLADQIEKQPVAIIPQKSRKLYVKLAAIAAAAAVVAGIAFNLPHNEEPEPAVQAVEEAVETTPVPAEAPKPAETPSPISTTEASPAAVPIIEETPEQEISELSTVVSTGNHVDGLITQASSRTAGGGSAAGDHIPECCFCADPTLPGISFLGTEAAYSPSERVFYNTIIQPCPGYIHGESTLTEDSGGEFVDHELIEDDGKYYYKFTVKENVTDDFIYTVTYTIIDEIFGNIDTRSVGIALKYSE